MKKIHAFLGVFLCFGVFAFAENDAVLNDSTTQENSRIYNAAENAENSGVYRSGMYKQNNDTPFVSSQTSDTGFNPSQDNSVGYVVDTRKKFGFDLGVGYAMSNLTAVQPAGPVDTKAMLKGVDIFMGLNIYSWERFGFSFGTGVEILKGSFKDALYECDYTLTMWRNNNGSWQYRNGSGFTCQQNNGDWSVVSWYFSTGVFADVLKFKNFSLRAFGNIGLAMDWFNSDGNYDKHVLSSSSSRTAIWRTYTDTDESISPETDFMYSLGLRFIFFQNHGLDLIAKHYQTKWKYEQKLPIIVETQVERGWTYGVRYIYEF